MTWARIIGDEHDMNKALPTRLSDKTRFTLLVLALAAIASAHAALQIYSLLTTGTLLLGAYLLWHTIAAVGLVAAFVFFSIRRFLFCYCLLLLLMFDFAFGMGSAILGRYGVLGSFMPSKAVADLPFTYHPLLQGVPKRSFVGEWVLPHKTIKLAHNADGYRRNTETAPDKPTILVLGGSTTYDIGVSNSHTWVERLEAHSPAFQFLNLGVPGYTTVEHLIQTAIYFPEQPKPLCAVYYVGWTDARNSHVPNLDPGFADFHLRGQIKNLNIVRQPHLGSPLLTFAVGAARAASFPELSVPSFADRPLSSGIDHRLTKLFTERIDQIALLNSARDIKTVFVGQILNFSEFTKATSSTWTPLVADKDVRHIIEDLNAAVRRVAELRHFTYIDVDPAAFVSRDFVDNGHFSEAGADKFARMIGPGILRACTN